MQYSININQLAITQDRRAMGAEVDRLDAAILNYLYFLCSSVSAKVDEKRVRHKNATWTWVNYKSIMADMPLLNIKTKSSISVRLRKLVNAGYILLYRRTHQQMYVRLLNKVDELFVKANTPVRQNEQLPSQELFAETNTTISLNNSITSNEVTRPDYRKRLQSKTSRSGSDPTVGETPKAEEGIEVKHSFQARARYVTQRLGTPKSMVTSVLKVCKEFPPAQIDAALSNAADATVENKTSLFFKKLWESKPQGDAVP